MLVLAFVLGGHNCKTHNYLPFHHRDDLGLTLRSQARETNGETPNKR